MAAPLAALLSLVALATGPPPAQALRQGGDDPRRAEQYALDLLHLPQAWSASTGAGEVIAILDTGVDPTHPDLAAHLEPGIDLVDGDGRPTDPNGHGTHVAGIAAAVRGNGGGIAGAAPDARLLPVRVLRADGSGVARTIADGVDWATAHGADVINLSVGGEGLTDALFQNGPLNRAVRNAAARGVVVVAAAGNDAVSENAYRPTVPVLVVNATDRVGRAAPFTTFGDAGAVAAPGMGITSTAPTGPTVRWPAGTDGYASMDGTSMSAAFVSATAALLLAEGLSVDEVRRSLTDTARNPDDDARLGVGLVDAAAAVNMARELHRPPAVDGETTRGSFSPWLAPLAVIAAAVVLPAAALSGARKRRSR